MAVYSISPWRKRSGGVSAEDSDIHPLRSLQQEVDGIFDNFFRGFNLSAVPQGFSSPELLAPKMNIAETDKEYQLSLELPGVEEKNIDVSLSGDVLTIKAEKKSDIEEKDTNYHRVERSYGTYQRALTLPQETDRDKIKADFKNGVLLVSIPKSAKAVPSVKKIAVKKGD